MKLGVRSPCKQIKRSWIAASRELRQRSHTAHRLSPPPGDTPGRTKTQGGFIGEEQCPVWAPVITMHERCASCGSLTIYARAFSHHWRSAATPAEIAGPGVMAALSVLAFHTDPLEHHHRPLDVGPVGTVRCLPPRQHPRTRKTSTNAVLGDQRSQPAHRQEVAQRITCVHRQEEGGASDLPGGTAFWPVPILA